MALRQPAKRSAAEGWVEGGVGLAMVFALPSEGGAGKAVAGKITGFTKHGINSAISHDGVGVASAAIFDAVKNPLKTLQQFGGRICYTGKDASVTLNSAGEVITTWARSHAGWRISP